MKKFVPGRITQRLMIYVAIASVTVLIPDISGTEPITVRQGVVIALNAILAGLIACRAYIDESPATMRDAP